LENGPSGTGAGSLTFFVSHLSLIEGGRVDVVFSHSYGSPLKGAFCCERRMTPHDEAATKYDRGPNLHIPLKAQSIATKQLLLLFSGAWCLISTHQNEAQPAFRFGARNAARPSEWPWIISNSNR
jgi:hypothetical protein